MISLDIYAGHDRVGTVAHDPQAEAWELRYDSGWVQSQGAFPLSNNLPREASAHPSATIRRFLQHLLPEGDTLESISTMLQESKDNVAGLIRRLGEEPVGAFTFVPTGHRPSRGEAVPREVTLTELNQRIRERPAQPIFVWDGSVRLSIAGVQDKLGLHVAGPEGPYFLPDGELASTHILKFDRINDSHTPHLVANEHFCMSLAARALEPGTAAAVAILRAPSPVLVVERFDRRWRSASTGMGSAEVARKHVIDACQALDLPISMKYERHMGDTPDVAHLRDGVSAPKIFGLAPRMAEPARATATMLDWMIFNVLIGNADAHGKNLSFYVHREHLEVAPLYDLVSTEVYPGIANQMAMGIGDAFQFSETAHAIEWAEFAALCGLNQGFVARRLRAVAENVVREAHALAEHDGALPYTASERQVISDIVQVVDRHASYVLKAAELLPRVRPDELSAEAESALAARTTATSARVGKRRPKG